MDTVTISSNYSISLEDLKPKLATVFPTILASGPERLIVRGPTSRVYIYHHNNEDGSTDSTKIYLDYRSVRLIKEILIAIGDDDAYVIDNDFGTILRGDEFVARLRSDPAWEWRV